MRTIAIGTRLISAHFLIRYNSVNEQTIKFWEDIRATIPSPLTDVTSAFMEVYVNSTTTVTWPATVAANEVSFELTPANTQVEWETRPFNLVLMKPERNVVLSGEVVVQR